MVGEQSEDAEPNLWNVVNIAGETFNRTERLLIGLERSTKESEKVIFGGTQNSVSVRELPEEMGS